MAFFYLWHFYLLTFSFGDNLAHQPSGMSPCWPHRHPPASIAAICQWMDTSSWQLHTNSMALGRNFVTATLFSSPACGTSCGQCPVCPFVPSPSLLYTAGCLSGGSERQSSAKPFLTCPGRTHTSIERAAGQPGRRTKEESVVSFARLWLWLWPRPGQWQFNYRNGNSGWHKNQIKAS